MKATHIKYMLSHQKKEKVDNTVLVRLVQLKQILYHWLPKQQTDRKIISLPLSYMEVRNHIWPKTVELSSLSIYTYKYMTT